MHPYPDQDSSPATGGSSEPFDAAPSYTPIEPSFQERVADVWANPRVQLGVRIAGISGAVLLVGGVVAWNVLLLGKPGLPPADELWTLNRKPAVQFVDADGQTLAVRGNLYGPIVKGAELPPYVGQAFIAAEDQRFLQHDGVDPQSIARAMFANISAQRTVQGGSTLTQQLVKNLLVGDEKTFRRKAQEADLAVRLEKELSKQEILDLYLNRVYLGANAYGVEAAALAYFGKPASDLTLAEAAFLGALPKAPSRYAENRTSPETTARVHYVLDRMVESRFVTAADAAAAKAETLVFIDGETLKPISGYVLDQALAEARAVVPDLPPDAVITLTVSGDLQRRAEAALNAALSAKGLGASQGAIVVMERTGEIRALVGGRDYAKSQFNRATQARRQPGSTFKTFVYAAALEQGLDPASVRNDAPVQIANWQPANYEDTYRGEITLAEALAVSSNSVAVQVGSEVGPKQVAKLAKRFGIESPMRAYPSIALGADEVTLLEMTRAYGVLANEGRLPSTRIISEIRDQRGEVLYTAPANTEPQVYGANTAMTMTGMLSNVVRYGTGAQAQVPGWQIAGKTGTSQSWRDAWFVGYSARMVGGVWIGNDNDKAMKKVTGGGAAASLFAKVMTSAHRGLKPAPLPGSELGPLWMNAVAYEDAPVDPLELTEGAEVAGNFVAQGSAPPEVGAPPADVQPAPASSAVTRPDAPRVEPVEDTASAPTTLPTAALATGPSTP